MGLSPPSVESFAVWYSASASSSAPATMIVAPREPQVASSFVKFRARIDGATEPKTYSTAARMLIASAARGRTTAAERDGSAPAAGRRDSAGRE